MDASVEMSDFYGDSAPLSTQVKYWVAEFSMAE